MQVFSIISAAALASLSAAQSSVSLQSVQSGAPTVQSAFTTVVGATSAAPVPAPSGTDAPPAKGVCGQGYTYCGYILRDHQGFEQPDIVKAYCAGNKDNCANGKTKSDPLQALYVCVPGSVAGGSASPPPTPRPALRMEHQDHDNMMGGMMGGLMGGMKGMNGLHQRQAPPSPTGGGGSCSVPTTGNRLVLLCSCTAGNATCLNPVEDHIGRCDTPCAS